jgi:hypothetical protein
MFAAEGTPIGNVYHCARILPGRDVCLVHRPPLLIGGVLKESDRKKKRPGKKATGFLESLQMDTFRKIIFMRHPRRLELC